MDWKRKRTKRGEYDSSQTSCSSRLNTHTASQAYAMDGNARVKRGLAAMVTTFGVGELSALNGVGASVTNNLKV
jgi:TPP-dependent 2-oxoacid decarboxylase